MMLKQYVSRLKSDLGFITLDSDRLGAWTTSKRDELLYVRGTSHFLARSLA